jgi:hypothetical protein
MKTPGYYAIWDLEEGAWVLDCFDNVRDFATRKDAETYRRMCRSYNYARYEVREWSP